MKNLSRIVLLVVGALLTTASYVQAQKERQNIRLPVINPIEGVDNYLSGSRETIFEAAAVFDNLIHFEEPDNRFHPLLAKSWTHINDSTIELDLRDDVKWQDGQPFTAKDVVYTMNWLIDPQTNMRNKTYYDHIAGAEQLGPYKVRIRNHQATPFDIARLATLMPIYPEHVHAGLKDKFTFGRKPVGTGPYRATQVDSNLGVILERNDQYNHGGNVKPLTNVRQFTLLPIRDMGTQIASLLAGTLDLIVPVEIDQATSLKADPRFQLTQTQGINYYYWAIDSTGRAGNKALLDSRVRRALMMAVDRSKLIGVITGNDNFPRVPPAICWAEQQGCGVTEKYPVYDPASARRLLAEAGYPNGFEMQITCASGATHRINAEILSGFFAKIGVKASIEVTTRPVYQRKQRDGELQMYTAGWTAGGMPDVAGIVSFFLSPEESSRYHDDKTLRTLADESMQTMDLEKRRKLAGQAFDRAAQEGYFYAFAPYPMAIVHKKEIEVQDRRRYSAFGFEPQDVRWK